jgi:hypothetical protein
MLYYEHIRTASRSCSSREGSRRCPAEPYVIRSHPNPHPKVGRAQPVWSGKEEEYICDKEMSILKFWEEYDGGLIAGLE